MESALGAGALAAGQAEGKLKTKKSAEIGRSPISIGFEVLDRDNFDPERCYPHLAELGVKWARCQTGWFKTEPRKGEYDFRWLDRVVDKMREIGIEPWFNLGFGNPIYTPGSAHPSSVGWAPVFTPEAREGWSRFVTAMAERYRDRVRAWEIWNEPNGEGFWLPKKPDPADYAALVKMTAPLIRAVIPDAVIVGASAFGPAFDFIEAAMEAGMGKYVDKISFHPYRPQPEWNYASEVATLRAMIARFGKPIPLWQGENGAPSANDNNTGALSHLDWNEERQAKWLLRRILSDLSLGIELTSYFHTADFINYVRASGPTGLNNFKGILSARDYTPKPSFFALQNLCTLFDGATQAADFNIRVVAKEQDMALCTAAFVRRGHPIYSVWAPADLQKAFTPRTATISTWCGKAARIDNPVLLDPLTGNYKVIGSRRTGGTVRFGDVPVADYPLLITDLSVVSPGPRLE
jgi:polysaccharide biosynthesis protein PslG